VKVASETAGLLASGSSSSRRLPTLFRSEGRKQKAEVFSLLTSAFCLLPFERSGVVARVVSGHSGGGRAGIAPASRSPFWT